MPTPQPLPILFALCLTLPLLATAQSPLKAVNYWETEPAFQHLRTHDITVLTCSNNKKRKAYREAKGASGLPLFIHPRCGDSNLMASSFSGLSDPLMRFDSRSHKHVIAPGFNTLNTYVITKYQKRQPVFASFRFVTQSGVVKQQIYIR